MPVCFQLIDRTSGMPATLQTVDRQLCQNLDLPFDDDFWVSGWYDYIGLRLALGKTFAEITDSLHEDIAYYRRCKDAQHDAFGDPKAEVGDLDYDTAIYRRRTMLRINAFLQEHYKSDAWREVGR